MFAKRVRGNACTYVRMTEFACKAQLVTERWPVRRRDYECGRETSSTWNVYGAKETTNTPIQYLFILLPRLPLLRARERKRPLVRNRSNDRVVTLRIRKDKPLSSPSDCSNFRPISTPIPRSPPVLLPTTLDVIVGVASSETLGFLTISSRESRGQTNARREIGEGRIWGE